MVSPPLTDREYAYFSIAGSGTHEAVTAAVGLEPSEALNIGEVNPNSGKPSRFMRWVLRSGHDDTEPLQTHIESLLLFLGTKQEELRKLWVDYELTIQCVGYYPPSGHGAYLSRDQVRKAAQLGVAFDFDFYYVDSHGHDG